MSATLRQLVLLSEALTVKHFESTLVRGDSILQHMMLTRFLGAPGAVVSCILGAGLPDIADNFKV